MKIQALIAVLIAIVALTVPSIAEANKNKRGAHPVRHHAHQVKPGPASDPYSVYVGGEYIGRDPDPNIRAYMMRNPHQWDGPE
jgi:hypothetical protein